MTLVSMIDVLAILQPDVDADVVLVRFRGGASHALSIREIIRGDDYRMRLDRRDDGSIRATLHSNVRPVPSVAVTSLRTVTFAEFVGGPTARSA